MNQHESIIASYYCDVNADFGALFPPKAHGCIIYMYDPLVMRRGRGEGQAQGRTASWAKNLTRSTRRSLGMVELPRNEWLKIALIMVLVAACIFLTIWFHFVSDAGYVFPNLYYVPIILSCLWWDRKGLLLAAFLSAFLVISSAFSPGEQPLWDDMIRAGVFMLVAVVIAELSARRKELIGSLEERVRKRTEELQVRNEELDTFSRTVSHDLIGPLSTLHGYVEVAREAASDGESGLESESIEAIGALSMRLSHTVEELLEYARAGRQERESELINPSQAANEVVDELTGLISGKSIEVQVEEGLPDILVDEVKLKQVLSNLISNSIKHAAGDGSLLIDIGGYEKGDEAVFFVRDDGIGIEKGMHDEVFKEFERYSAGGETPGLGLGLSIVKRAVEGWGGRVWLESTPGEGATFFFTAPTLGVSPGHGT
jgi:signal transduction histidine kinase